MNGMNMHKLIQHILSITIVLVVNGCSSTNIKNDNNAGTDKDLLQLRTEADQAYQNNDLQLSEQHYETLIKELPEEALHWFRLGNIYVRTNRPYAAMNLYREAVIRDPKFAKAWYNLGVVQLKQTAFSLNEMLIYTDKTDPLYEKAETMLNEITNIIQE